ncbi:DUF2971 domain-containing protein [Roseibaca sp. V10]|uniref:DUF2971 domain-containing protein n=1 Tax=Roseinatronobacter domitianus TaxID=2940293 RepID=A0ABT0LY36_9RHOB|nr:DUF2971 domain-containing protein [Roseibaca domitiana]MCL1627248.1 DUF2971 domain-containing protein [Roseibaca domitiana]
MVGQVHHYCSASVFLSFIKNKEIWLTALSQSNDHLEGTWMLRKWLELFDRSKDQDKTLKKKGARFAVETILDMYVALGTCFSEERDLLSQWRGYAADGTGFSISFDKEALTALASNSTETLPLTMSKVYYGHKDNKQSNEVIRILNDAFGEDAEKYKEYPDGIGDRQLAYTREKFKQQKNATRLLFTIKNEAFAEEREWRLFTFESVSKIKGVEFRESRGVLSPFVKFKIPVEAIRGITLGPTNKTPLKTIKNALQIHGITCPVSPSNASYRGF